MRNFTLQEKEITQIKELFRDSAWTYFDKDCDCSTMDVLLINDEILIYLYESTENSLEFSIKGKDYKLTGLTFNIRGYLSKIYYDKNEELN